MHPSVQAIFQYFAYDHLPPHLQQVSSRFHALAEWLIVTGPSNPELTVALRKLLEAKDAAVRSRLTDGLNKGAGAGAPPELQADPGHNHFGEVLKVGCPGCVAMLARHGPKARFGPPDGS